jgi:hypothetical protein
MRDKLLTEREVESYDHRIAWFSINHSILAGEQHKNKKSGKQRASMGW